MNELLIKLNECFKHIDANQTINSLQISKDASGYDIHLRTNSTHYLSKYGLSEAEVLRELSTAIDKANSQWQSFDL